MLQSYPWTIVSQRTALPPPHRLPRVRTIILMCLLGEKRGILGLRRPPLLLRTRTRKHQNPLRTRAQSCPGSVGTRGMQHHAPTDWWRALQPFLGVSSDGRAGEWRHALQRECGALRAVPQRGPKRRPKREPEREPNSATSAGSRAQPPAPAPAPATAPATSAARARPSFVNRVLRLNEKY